MHKSHPIISSSIWSAASPDLRRRLSDSFLRRSFSFISPSVASAVAVIADVVVPIPAFDPPPPRPSGDPPSPWLPCWVRPVMAEEEGGGGEG
jgi:hypothetical protein